MSGRPLKPNGAGNVACVAYSEPQVSRNFDLFSVGTGVFLIFSVLFSGIIHSVMGKGIAVIAVVIIANLLIVCKNRFLIGRVRGIVSRNASAYSELLAVEPWLRGKTGADTHTVALWTDRRSNIHSGIMSCHRDPFGCDVYILSEDDARADSVHLDDMETPWFDRDNDPVPGRYWT